MPGWSVCMIFNSMHLPQEMRSVSTCNYNYMHAQHSLCNASCNMLMSKSTRYNHTVPFYFWDITFLRQNSSNCQCLNISFCSFHNSHAPWDMLWELKWRLSLHETPPTVLSWWGGCHNTKQGYCSWPCSFTACSNTQIEHLTPFKDLRAP